MVPVLVSIGTFIFTFVGIFLLGLCVDFKETYRKIKDGIAKETKKVEESANNESLPGKLINWTEEMIQKSNLRVFVGYNVWMHFLLCIGSSLLAYHWISKSLTLITSLSFSVVALLMPYIVLQVVTEFFARFEKKNAINFLIILKAFLKTGVGDIFEAFKRAAKFTLGPIRNYINVMVYEYEHKINALTCLDNFKEKLGTPELKLFIENIKICYVQGGDYVALADTFIKDLSGQDEDDEKEDAEDTVLNYGLYILIFLNFVIIYWMINGAYKREILDSLWGQAVFIVDMVVVTYIIFMSLKKT